MPVLLRRVRQRDVILFYFFKCNTEWSQLSIDRNASWIPPFRIPQKEHKNVSVERDIWNTVN